MVSAPLQQADAIVVLSGAAAYKERTRYAAEVFKAGRAPRIILTNDNYKGGWSAEKERNPFYYELESTELQRNGVPADRIDVLPEPVDGTYEETLLIKRYAESKGLNSILVVTSAYHSRRAWWTLRKVFRGSSLSVGLEPVAPGVQMPQAATWWLQIRGWEAVPTEYAKMVYYWLRIA